MRKFLFVALCALVCATAIAQEHKNFFRNLEYTVSAGYGSTIGDDPFDNAILTFNAGVDVKANLKSFKDGKYDLYGLVGVLYTQRGGKQGILVQDWADAGNSIRINRVSIPLYAGIRWKISKNSRLFLDLGPYVGFNLGSNISSGYGSAGYKLEDKKFDVGLGGNIGFAYRKFGVSIGLDKGFLPSAKYIPGGSKESSKNIKTMSCYIKLQLTFNRQ